MEYKSAHMSEISTCPYDILWWYFSWSFYCMKSQS